MCLIQDVPTLGRHPVKRVHAAVPSAAEDDFPAFGTSQRVLAYDLPRTGCRSLWTRTMLAMLGCAGETVRMRSRHCVPFRRARRLAGVAARKQERYVLMLMTKRLNGLSRFGKLSGLGISHIPAAPRPSDVAPGWRWNSTSAARAIPWRAGRESPEHLRATGLQQRRPGTGSTPAQGIRSPAALGLVMLAPVGEFFLVDFQVQLGNARSLLHCVSNRPVVDDRRDFLQEESQQRAGGGRSALPCSGRNTAGSTRPPYRAVPVQVR